MSQVKPSLKLEPKQKTKTFAGRNLSGRIFLLVCRINVDWGGITLSKEKFLPAKLLYTQWLEENLPKTTNEQLHALLRLVVVVLLYLDFDQFGKKRVDASTLSLIQVRFNLLQYVPRPYFYCRHVSFFC